MPVWVIFAAAAAVVAYLYSNKDSQIGTAAGVSALPPPVTPQSPYPPPVVDVAPPVPEPPPPPVPAPVIGNLPDVDPARQSGVYKQDFDDAFDRATIKWGVPFALLKAHAVRESALDPNAYRLEPTGKASYGLMQILWWPGSNRFAKWGYNDDYIRDGSPLYDPYVNCDIAAQLIKDNWNTFGNLRDIVNAYNTGVAESKREAPGDYVNDVLNAYSQLLGVEDIEETVS